MDKKLGLSPDTMDLYRGPLELKFLRNIYAEKIDILYKGLLVSIPANFLCVMIVFISLHRESTKPIILTWFITNLILSLLRLLTYYFYKRNSQEKLLYLTLFIIGTLISAVLWGFCASFLMPSNLLGQMVVIVIIAGITAGGSQTLQANVLAYFIYMIGILLPLCVWLFIQNDTSYLLLGTAMSTYLVFMLMTGWQSNIVLDKTLQLRYKNLQLVHGLSSSNKKLKKTHHLIEDKLAELKQHETEMKFINKTNEMLQTCQKLQEAYEIIVQSAKELFHPLSGGLAVYDSMLDNMEIINHWGNQKYIKKNFPLNDCWALREGHPYLILDSKTQFICHHFSVAPPDAYFCLPQITPTGAIGMLILCANKGESISPHEQHLATTFNDVIKLSLTNIRLHEVLSDISNHDPLTRLYNRHFLNEIFPREILRTIREEKPLCVCMLDIDFFKKVNDKYGHDAGDEVLKNVGKIILDSIRHTDIACRFGGDEFLLILIDVDLKAALPILQVICEKIKTASFSYDGHILIEITMSVGISQAPIHGNSVKDIICAADAALYHAKETGGDRVVLYGDY